MPMRSLPVYTLAGFLLVGFGLTGCAAPGNRAGVPSAAGTAQGASAEANLNDEEGQSAVGSAAYAPGAIQASGPVPSDAAPIAPSGTYVGQKARALQGDLARLQANVDQHTRQQQAIKAETEQNASQYYALVGGISTRLQAGTTPGNPRLVAQWNEAQAQLGRLSSSVARMSDLSARVTSDSSLAAFLLDNIRSALTLQGAVDEDHVALHQLEDQVGRTLTPIDQLLNSLTGEVSRQNASIGTERANLIALSLAIKDGALFGARSLSSVGGSAAGPVRMASAPSPSDRRPLVVIRFDRANVAFDPQLYSAVNAALQRRPNSRFDVVAVAPSQGSSPDQMLFAQDARRNAEQVVRSLTTMGLAGDRIALSSATSAAAQSSEVHVFVR